jgi:hypothetical protein
MAGRPPIRTVIGMDTLAPPILLPLDGAEQASRLAHPARRRARRHRDGKLELMAAVDGLARCRWTDLEVLARTADLVHVGPGTVLAEGWEFRRQWWMPLEGWLLVEGEGTISRTVPAGRSWVAPRLPDPQGRLSALREATALVAPVHRLAATLEVRPGLGSAVRATLLNGDV